MVHNLNLKEILPISRVKSVLSQLLACMSPNLLLLDLGIAVSFTTIALPDLLNSNNGLTLNDTQASWFGSLSYLTQPVGAILSGPMVDYLGRKRANLIANIPHLFAWLLMHFAWNIPSLFLANALLGFGTGVMEGPINSYVGEISEPSVRGMLCTVTQLFAAGGILLIYFLGTVVNWRQAALACLVIPVLSMLCIILAPETPVWLLSKGREKEALKSLCQLRGWTSPENVQEEYDELVEYSKNLGKCVICSTNSDSKDCEHNRMNFFRRFILKFRLVLLCKETLRPWCFIMIYFLFYQMSGLMSIRPNMANVCAAFGMADDPNNIVLMVGIITFVVTAATLPIIKFVGKRKLGIFFMLGTASSTTALSIYAKKYLPNDVFSYKSSTFPVEKSVMPLVFFYFMVAFSAIIMTWIMLGEVFPFRSRASAQGFAAAFNYVIMFTAAKSFIDFEVHLGLWGSFAVYAAFAYVGAIFLYFFMPETEGKSLQEIESFFSKNFRVFADDPIFNFFKRRIKQEP